ncbi:MAG: helix-turn-helix domain-containing protein [Mangrovicoccus sp.]|nr:helix-turn-helix domain-containing protein [Mangrovicoccus sp.]
MNRSQFLEQFNREAKRKRSPQHRAARIREDNRITKEGIERRERFLRKQKLQTSRRSLSIARGLKTCREFRGMTRNEFAEAMGITRRALYNYETGQRSIPSDLIERVAKEGDLEFHEIFGSSFENAPVEQRKSDAALAIQLYLSLKERFSKDSQTEHSHIAADDADIQRVAAEAAASWSVNAKVTEKSISNVTKRVAEDLADDYALTDLANSWHIEND